VALEADGVPTGGVLLHAARNLGDNALAAAGLVRDNVLVASSMTSPGAQPAGISFSEPLTGLEMDARGKLDHLEYHELHVQNTSPVGNNDLHDLDIFKDSIVFQQGHEYLYPATQEAHPTPVSFVSGHTTHNVSQIQEKHEHNVNNDEQLHPIFQASAATSAPADTNYGQRRLSEIEDNLHGVQRKLGEIGEHFSAFSNALESLLLGRETASMGSSHLLPPGAAAHGLDMLHPTASGNLFCAGASDAAPGILPPDPLRVAASHGLYMLHPTASGNLFCAGASDAAPGILPPDPLRVAASHSLDMRHNAASGNLFCEGASDAAPGILPPDPLRVAAWHGLDMLHPTASGNLFCAEASDAAPGILPPDPLRVAAWHGLDMLHPTASGNLFCAEASDAAPGILPPDPLRVAASHGLDMRHNAASGNLFCAGASHAAPGILPPDPLRAAASSAQKVLSSSTAPLSLAKTGCLETQETKTHVDQEQEYEILSFREEIIQGKRWPLCIISNLITDRGTLYNMSKGGDLTFTFSLQELEADTVESTSVYYTTTKKNETARSVMKRHSLTLEELRRRNSRLDKIEKLGERSKFKKNTFLNVGDATTKKPRTRFQCRDGKL